MRSTSALRSSRKRRKSHLHGEALYLHTLEQRILFAVGLVAEFGFNEGAGATTTDTSGLANNGAISNATWTAAGKYNGALSFNGTNSWITVNDAASLRLTNGMTLEAWVRPVTRTGFQTVILKERPVNGLSYALYSTDDSNRPPAGYINKGGTSVSIVGNSNITLSAWTHLAVTYNGSKLILYVNGVAKSKNTTGNILENNGALRIGGNSVWGEYFNGLIDEVRVYNRALSASEITTDMNTPIAPAVDNTPPTVTNRTPAPGATGVDLSTTITATFNESIQPATVVWSVVDAASNPVTGTPTYNATTRVATFTPTSQLTGNTQYTINLSGAKDIAGNTLASPVAWSFTTLVPDTTPPTVTNRTPAAGATGIANTTNLTVTFSEAVQAGTINWQVLDAANNPVTGTPTYNATTRTATFTPTSALANSTQYTVNVSGAKDTAGNTLVSTETWSFTTAAPAATPPIVIGRTPASGATGVARNTTVTATFNESVVPATIIIELRDGGGNLIAGTGAYDDALHKITFTPGSPLNYLTTYTATVSGATDLEGSAMTAPANWTFTTITSANDPAVVGQWSSIIDFPIVAINQVMLKDGRILMWDGGASYCQGASSARVYNPATGTFTGVPIPYDIGTLDLFCSAAVVMADGRVLVVGGHDCTGVKYGIKALNIFNPDTMTWTKAPDMFYARWYPTATVLSDGKVLITAGSDIGLTTYIPIPELYDPVTNTVTRLQNANFTIPNYPFVFLLPDGNVIVTGSDEGQVQTKILNVATQTWTTIDSRLLDGGSGVMYRPGMFMKSGRWYLSEPADNGGTVPSVKTTYVLDMTQPTPLWQTTQAMAFARTHHNLTLLPDGDVLVTGGSSQIGGYDVNTAIYAAELWDPDTKTWTTMASSSVPRMYHSTALLMPDGRVLSTGGGRNAAFPDFPNAQYYSPAYLFKGPRPVITSVASQLQYNSSFFVQTPDASRIASVALIRNGADTHAFDEDQRYVPLAFSQTAGGLNVVAPIDSRLAPPGYYMLFIVDTNGVPSIAPFVRFPAPYEDNTPPSIPGNLIATGGIGSVQLTWDASTDNTGVAGYNVYRSTVSGFTPSAANLIAQTGSTTLADLVPAGTYYYIVKARDAAGNLSASSLEAPGTATLDNIAPTVSITSPTSGSTLSGTVTVNANAGDNVGVVGVTFLLDGNSLGAEDTSSPWSFSWTTSTAANGAHLLTARARDAQGNLTTSAQVSITINNVAPTGLVASYNFNQGAGSTLTDGSGNNLNGTIANATWVAGHTGGALSFNGTNSMVTIADNNLLDFTNNLTVEAWVRPATINGFETVVLKEMPGGLAYALYAADGNGRPPSGYVRIGNSELPSVGGSLLTLNTWYHLAMTYNGSTFKMFINGVQVSSVNVTGNVTTTTGALRIGGNSIWGEYFSGLIDDVRLYNRALSVTEIQTDMNTGL